MRGSTGRVPIPERLPLLTLPGTILFPHGRLALDLDEPREIALADAALAGGKMLALFPAEAGGGPLRRGTAARIEQMRRRDNGSIWLNLAGLSRIDRLSVTDVEPFVEAAIRPAPSAGGSEVRIEALRRACVDGFLDLVRAAPAYGGDMLDAVGRVSTAGQLADLIASRLRLSFEEKRELLEMENVEERLDRLDRLLDRERKILAIEDRIKKNVDAALAEKEKTDYLRQQMETIREELGEEDEREAQLRALDHRLGEYRLPGPVEEACRGEIARLGRMPAQSGEFSTTRQYIDWVLGLPWTAASEDTIDLDQARVILDHNHHGLDKIKERVLEFLAVRKLKSDSPSPLLCFAGPPGVGKTSLALSIAEALHRVTARIPLGGVTDESEIRGRRRAYPGALPGRILQELRRVGVRNPLILLDEIDKVGSQFRGDPSASLLEVLDPEQNRRFTDHYIDIPFDLSEVFFISTASSVDSIPPGLLDRLEIIEFPGYTQMEKVIIAEKHVIPKQIAQHGLKASSLTIRRRAIRRIAEEYTQEAGLRELERCIAALCRKRAVAWLDGRRGRVTIGPKDLEHSLGTPRFYPEAKSRRPEVGLSTALAWTPSGGQILFIEASLMPGHQSLQITGHLGDVMRESAETALSYVRSFLARQGAPPDLLENRDIHIHVPAGAIAKDGPSAGVAIATALYSLISGYPVRHNVAMTGEMTLRGHVLPVGGVKQKILGAYRTGIRYVIFPARNEPELREIPADVRKKIEIVPVEHMEEVFRLACVPPRKKRS